MGPPQPNTCNTGLIQCSKTPAHLYTRAWTPGRRSPQQDGTPPSTSRRPDPQAEDASYPPIHKPPSTVQVPGKLQEQTKSPSSRSSLCPGRKTIRFPVKHSHSPGRPEERNRLQQSLPSRTVKEGLLG